MHSGNYAYRDRRARKGEFRRLWIVRINAACRQNDISYSRFIAGPEGGRDRGRPQDPRRPRGARLRRRSARSSPPRARRSKLPEQHAAPALGPRHREVKRLRALLRDRRARAAEGAFVLEGPRAVDAALDRGARVRRRVPRARRRRRVPPRCARGSTPPASTWRCSRKACSRRSGSTAHAAAGARGRDACPPPARDVLGGRRPRRGRRRAGRSGQPRHAAAQRGGVGRRGNRRSGRGSVDAYNPKVVRASAGAIFGVPVVDAESEGWSTVEALDALGELGRQRLGAAAGRGAPYAEVDFTRPTAVVLGNEAHGLRRRRRRPRSTAT